MNARACTCETPCTSSSYGRCVYTYPNKDFRFYPGIPRGTEHWDNLYRHRVVIERTIHTMKDTFALDSRRSHNTVTAKADVFIAGIVQLVTVILADAVHKRELFKSIRKLIAWFPHNRIFFRKTTLSLLFLRPFFSLRALFVSLCFFLLPLPCRSLYFWGLLQSAKMIFNKTAHKDSRQQSPPTLCAHNFCQIVSPGFLASLREQLSNNKHDCTTPAGLLLGFRLSYRTISIPCNRMFCNGKDQYSAMIQLGKCKTSVNMRKFIYGHLFRWLFPRSAAGSDGFREDVTDCFTRFWLS